MSPVVLGMLTRARKNLRAFRRARRERLASARRDMLGSAPVVAVTGSAATTTTVKLVSHLLGGPPRVGVSIHANTARDVLGHFTRLGPDTTAVVVEASEFPRGNIARTVPSIRPTVAVLTISGLDHFTDFRGSAEVANEMSMLAKMMPPDSLVVLNADDDDLRRAVVDIPGRIITFGMHADADYRASALCVGPDHRLSVTCLHRGEEINLTTPFIGNHFHVTTLAAVAVAHQLGVPWDEIHTRLKSFEPVFGRCTMLAIPEGPLFICDTMKSPAWSIRSSLETLDSFTGKPRRTLVLGTLSDYPGSSRGTYRKAWREARQRVDRAIFLRHSPSHVGASADEVSSGRTLFFDSVQQIASHLRATAIPGEAILLKGSARADHLDRIAHDFVAPVSCWLGKCGRNMNCINCEWMRDKGPIALRPLKSVCHKLAGRRRIYG